MYTGRRERDADSGVVKCFFVKDSQDDQHMLSEWTIDAPQFFGVIIVHCEALLYILKLL